MKKTLVIGASANPDRYSFKALNKLVEHNHTVVAIGQKIAEVAGVKIQTKAIPATKIHTVSMYINSVAQRDYYNYIIGLSPKRVLFNPGTENPEFYQLLKANTIKYEEACTLVLLATNQY
ncbi:CoA-binding protein [uncultured Flavobacterium sp.]|uniref:CoA-binding protein n=1 Tax=uncultured Flavobacterium sp. TaxID=165435 RepID=UPI0030CA361E|tara:strand:+ start:441 stop:800 length:360 start_codon:yes stop_codon:yes gene_type:complete